MNIDFKKHYPKILLGIFLILWLILAINPTYRFDWFLENLLVFIFVPILILTYNHLRLSNISYTLIFIFMSLHSIGAHYTYALVPLDWTVLGFSRNHYDRVVHFSFGLLLAYPIRELFMRIATARGFWAYYLPFDVTLAFSALYEIIEWLTAVIVAPEAGNAFLGTQRDEFDAIKDMALAGTGAALSMVITSLVNLKYNKQFSAEIKESFSVKGKLPLGEVRLQQMIAEKGKKKNKAL
ncbi:DUF2238 domain-containing protein [Candidatus Woesearchaeota archaeon]|nr:DUF2238 domain-containing protein [Candidatus Woesearchaeota archaeon]